MSKHNMSRYCLQKLREYNEKTKLEIWVSTERCSDSLDVLMYFMSQGSRIVDTHHNNREVRKNFDPDKW